MLRLTAAAWNESNQFDGSFQSKQALLEKRLQKQALMNIRRAATHVSDIHHYS